MKNRTGYIVAGILLGSTMILYYALHRNDCQNDVRKKIDSVVIADSIAKVEERNITKTFDDTVQLMLRRDRSMSNFKFHVFRGELEPHPEIKQRKYPFFIEDSTRDGSILIVNLFGTACDGGPREGNILIRQDTLFLFHWRTPFDQPPAAYFKYRLTYEVMTFDQDFHAIEIIDLDPFMARKKEYFSENE